MKLHLLKIALGSTSILMMAACAGTPLADDTSVPPTPSSENRPTGPVRLEAKIDPQLKSRTAGSVVLEPNAAGDMTVVKYEITGLKKNSKHGFHIHEKGDCGDNGNKAGGHWNPNSTKHGDLHAHERHLGDFGNIQTDAKGVAKGEIQVPTFSLEAAKGLAVIVHAKADDLKSQPTGNSGDRIGCGVLQ
ncbi:MAG: superoxide dismutase family protein [Bdellovibrionaceae bacterium]|nr:superoxide dismutase family protein [Pseudobdellovibrionaceae bacterium]